MGLDIKMAASLICTEFFIEINTFACIMFRLHNFDSQLQCTIELNNRKTWTKDIKSKQTLRDVCGNKTNLKRHSDSGGVVSQCHIQQSCIKEVNDARPE